MASRERERTAKAGDVTIPHDPVSESILVAAAMADAAARKMLLVAVPTDKLYEPKHRAAWNAFQELDRQKLKMDIATLRKLGDIDEEYLGELAGNRPEVPSNLSFHLERVLWDGARLAAARGPISELVDAVRDPLADPGRVKALARQVSGSFDGYQDRKYLRDSTELVHEMMAGVLIRNEGVQSFDYGVPALDYYEKPEPDGNHKRRMIPGTMPGCATVITGFPGIGKSTLTAIIALALARARRRVLYGAWEMKGNMTLELLACIALGWSRRRFHLPRANGGLTQEELVVLEEKAHGISKYIRFLELPFNRRQGEQRKGGNQRNLDIIHGYIADTGCDIFVADLWKRCLVEIKPEDEELALERMQAILEETKVHGILVHQQLSKGESIRADKRPTAEGAKGSSMWREFADTMIGVHRPGAHKSHENTIMELIILKQRYGEWPLTIEFDWDGDRASLSEGRTVAYVGDDGGRMDDFFNKEAAPVGRRRRRSAA